MPTKVTPRPFKHDWNEPMAENRAVMVFCLASGIVLAEPWPPLPESSLRESWPAAKVFDALVPPEPHAEANMPVSPAVMTRIPMCRRACLPTEKLRWSIPLGEPELTTPPFVPLRARREHRRGLHAAAGPVRAAPNRAAALSCAVAPASAAAVPAHR